MLKRVISSALNTNLQYIVCSEWKLLAVCFGYFMAPLKIIPKDSLAIFPRESLTSQLHYAAYKCASNVGATGKDFWRAAFFPAAVDAHTLSASNLGFCISP